MRNKKTLGVPKSGQHNTGPQRERNSLHEERRESNSKASSSKSNLPKDRSRKGTDGPKFCELCHCWCSATGWETHVAGIRHRRAKLSQQVHGDSNHLVVSIFENLPQGQQPGPNNQYRSKDPVYKAAMDAEQQAKHAKSHAAGAGASTSSQSTSTSTGRPIDVNRLQSMLLRELVHFSGMGALYHKAAEKLHSTCLQKVCGAAWLHGVMVLQTHLSWAVYLICYGITMDQWSTASHHTMHVVLLLASMHVPF